VIRYPHRFLSAKKKIQDENIAANRLFITVFYCFYYLRLLFALIAAGRAILRRLRRLQCRIIAKRTRMREALAAGMRCRAFGYEASDVWQNILQFRRAAGEYRSIAGRKLRRKCDSQRIKYFSKRMTSHG